MTNERIKKLAYTPLTEAWKVIHQTQNLRADDTEGWETYIKAVDDYHNKYSDTPYGSALERAVIEIVDVIAKENKGGQTWYTNATCAIGKLKASISFQWDSKVDQEFYAGSVV